MHDLPALWLPILATAVGVFFASSLIHMVFQWHKREYGKLPNEDAVATALRASGVGAGQYVLPHCADMKDMGTPEMQKKFADGPIALLVLRKPGPPAIGASLAQWFALTLVIATVAGLLAVQTLGLGGNAHAAGHLVGMVTFLAYGTGSASNAVWMGRPWGAVALDLVDSLIYGTVSALIFMALWPHAAG